jgi:hypothetical protein
MKAGSIGFPCDKSYYPRGGDEADTDGRMALAKKQKNKKTLDA